MTTLIEEAKNLPAVEYTGNLKWFVSNDDGYPSDTRPVFAVTSKSSYKSPGRVCHYDKNTGWYRIVDRGVKVKIRTPKRWMEVLTPDAYNVFETEVLRTNKTTQPLLGEGETVAPESVKMVADACAASSVKFNDNGTVEFMFGSADDAKKAKAQIEADDNNKKLFTGNLTITGGNLKATINKSLLSKTIAEATELKTSAAFLYDTVFIDLNVPKRVMPDNLTDDGVLCLYFDSVDVASSVAKKLSAYVKKNREAMSQVTGVTAKGLTVRIALDSSLYDDGIDEYLDETDDDEIKTVSESLINDLF